MNRRKRYVIVLVFSIIILNQVIIGYKFFSYGYLDQVNVYEFPGYNPKYDERLNSSFQYPEMIFEEKFGLSVSQDGLYIRVYKANTVPQLIWVQIDQKSGLNLNSDLNVINLSNDYFNQLSSLEYYTVLGNLSHFWVISTNNDLKSVMDFRIEMFEIITDYKGQKYLNLLYNVTKSPNFIQTNGNHFLRYNILQTFLFQDSLWFQSIEIIDSVEIWFLNRFHPVTLDLIERKKIPNQINDNKYTIWTFDINSLWTSNWEFGWDGSVKSKYIWKPDWGPTNNNDHFRFIGISKESFIFVIDNFTDGIHNDFLGFYVIPKSDILIQITLTDFVIWTLINITCFSMLFMIFRNRKIKQKNGHNTN